MVTAGQTDGKRIEHIGTLLAERLPRLVQIDNYRLEASLQGYIIITQHLDQPGVVGDLGNCLGSAHINISRMQVGTDLAKPGNAMAILNVDRSLTSAEFGRLQQLPGIESVYQTRF